MYEVRKITAGFTDTLKDFYSGALQVMHDTDFIAFDISIPVYDTLFAIGMDVRNNRFAGLWKYNLTGSRIWHRINNRLPYNGYPMSPQYSRFEFTVSDALTTYNNDKRNIYYGSDVPFLSYDGGVSFTQIGQYWSVPTHADIRGLFLQTATNTFHGTGDICFFATDGGVSKKPSGMDPSAIGADATININGKGLACGQFLSVATSEAGGILVGGMSHDGIVSYEPNAIPHWLANPGGPSDAGTCNFDNIKRKQAYALENTCYHQREQTYSGARDIDGWDCIAPDAHEAGSPPIFIDSANTQYEGAVHLWRKLNTEGSFHEVSSGLNLPVIYGSIKVMCFSPYLRTTTGGDTLPVGYLVYNGSPNKLFYRNPLATGHELDSNIAPNDGYFPITGIAMDPQHPERVWICEGEKNFGSTSVLKAYYSNNGGNSWFNISEGLPLHMPMYKIIYQEGSTDILFCASEVGIYRLNFSDFDSTAGYPYGLHWECFSKGASGGPDFPNAYVTDLKINYCEGKLYAATIGRAIWASDLSPMGEAQQTTVTISGSPTWSGNQYMTGSIKIPSGAILRLQSDTLHMPKNGLIIVEPGGLLVVDGSLITNSCNQCLWGGIQARGNTGLSQTHTSDQGWVIVKNGSTIEHADIAISNCNTDPAHIYGSTGGIIQCSNSIFRDNHNSVTFHVYDNWIYDPFGSIIGLNPNRSYFSNCTFLLDDDYKGNTIGYPMNNMVYLSGVEGVSFTGNQFLNRDMAPIQKGIGNGIFAWNAGFNAGDYCPGIVTSTSGCSSPVRSRFSGFTNGICIKGAMGYEPGIGIDHVIFDSSSVGVNVSSINSVATTRCDFNIGHGLAVVDAVSESFSGCYQNIGIFTQNATLFNIEGNNFKGIPNTIPYWSNYGAVVANSQYYPSKIYRNSFDSLTAGVYAIGCNVNPSNPFSGLLILCNTFANSYTDIYVATDGSSYPQGIAQEQSSFSTVAGNTFSGSLNNIINHGRPIYYYYSYSDSAVEIPHRTYGLIIKTGETCTKSCPSTIPGPHRTTMAMVENGSLDPQTLASYKSSFYASKIALLDSQVVYNSLIDFGNTDSLVYIVDTTTDTTVLYKILDDGSPYISEKTLREVATVGALPYTSMMQILNKNPDDLHDYDFLSFMQNAFGLSDEEVNTLLGTNNTTTRTISEDNMSTLNRSLADYGNIILTALKSPVDTNYSVSDTVNGICLDSTSVFYMQDSNSSYVGFDSIDVWLQNIGTLWAQYERVGFNNFIGNTSNANSILSNIGNMLPANSSIDTANYLSYTKIWSAVYNAEQHDRDIYRLDSAEIAMLDTSSIPIFSCNTGVEKIIDITTGILNPTLLNKASNYPCLVTYGGSAGRMSNNPKNHSQKVNENANNQFTVYPNPTSGIVTFSYYVLEAGGDVKITVTNIVGETVKELHTGNNAGTIQWNPNNLASGVYIYKASSSKAVISNGKLVLIK